MKAPDLKTFGTTTCPQCLVRSPVVLLPGEICASCKSQNAWTQAEGGRLVIGPGEIQAALDRRRGEAAQGLHRQLLGILPAFAALALAGGAAVLLVQLLHPRPIGPLTGLITGLLRSGRLATLVGSAAFVASLFALWRLRKGRYFRRLPLVATSLLAIVVGVSTVVVGGLHWYGAKVGFGLKFLAMPSRDGRALGLPESPHVDAIMEATAIILAPDGDGDARGAALGTGAVIATQGDIAWIVTCSHVAMPYAAVAAWRHAASARPVWVQLADGRDAIGRVRWTARPPLDVALVAVSMPHPPRPVAIAPDSDALQESAPVTFVPNPLRDGWLRHSGVVLRRERHLTPAGEYSLLYTDLPVQPGDSGSGLFDAGGHLVGLNTWTQNGPGGYKGISLPSEAMRAIVDAIESDRIDQLDEIIPVEQEQEQQP